MPVLSINEVAALVLSVGLTGESAAMATAIAMRESGGNTDARGDVGIQTATWGPSIGLWQIRSLKAEYGKGSDRDEKANYDPVHNAQAMVHISANGTRWGAWSTAGAARLSLPAARAAVANPGATPAGAQGGQAGGGLNLLDGGTWSRGGLFVLSGAILLFVGWKLTGAGGAVKSAAKSVVKVVT